MLNFCCCCSEYFRGKFTFMAWARAGIINSPGERIPPSNIKSSLNRTELSSS